MPFMRAVGQPTSDGVIRHLEHAINVKYPLIGAVCGRSGMSRMAWNLLDGDSIRLSSRERQIVASLANGATAKEIAKELLISFHTVRAHIRNIYMKIGVCNRVELMRWLSYTGPREESA
jgi:DNA-binding CsgD family transcriptional regulator